MSRDALTYSREKPKHDGVHGSFLLALGSFHKELISPDPSITVVSEPVGKLRPREYIKNPYVKKKKEESICYPVTFSSQSCPDPQDFRSCLHSRAGHYIWV